jgi:hypothetical protein
LDTVLAVYAGCIVGSLLLIYAVVRVAGEAWRHGTQRGPEFAAPAAPRASEQATLAALERLNVLLQAHLETDRPLPPETDDALMAALH